jgi:hypothetical protein
MGTRSIIAMKDGEVFKSIYCQYDGYPEHHYPILSNFYNTTEKVRELMKMGDISVLDESIESSIFYGRDRKELATKHSTFKSYNDLIRESKGVAGYFYYWDGEKWLYF